MKHVLIATPTAGQVVTAAYSTTLINATRVLTASGLDYHHATFDGADIVMARNYLANRALQNPDCGWVLWLDSDMAVPAIVFTRMLELGQAFVGGVYTERSLDIERYAQLRMQGFPEVQARAMSANFNVRVAPGPMTIRNGFCAVKGLGFGCVLMRRELLERLAKSDQTRTVPSGKLKNLGLPDTMVDFFSELPRDNGGYLSEDYSFCERVSAIGETVWALADVPIGHVGRFEYGGSFLEQLKGRQALKDREAE
jgi:hypothetical protein